MKRYSGLHDKLCTIENIEVADDNARKNKNKKYGINKHDKNRQYENEDLVDKLFNLKYKLLNIVYIKYMNQKNVLFIDFLIIQIELLIML
ncbi:MAG: MatK/TrnK amino terminal region [Bacteriophage sp.]|nr:MAG: MatK/TrnK amino terminal region [Bacteriophage sp.]